MTRSLLAALFLCLAGSATPAADITIGLASVDDGRPTRFDGANYHGKVADGSRFKTASLAVAHRTLPLGSVVVVSYRGREAKAVVNDRGPCLSSHCQRTAPARVRARVLDMTPALARALRFPGLGRVAFWPLQSGGNP